MWLRATPGGRRLVRVKSKTEFGSPRVFAVVRRRGPWVAVMAAELNNGHVGWLDARSFTQLYRVPYTMEISLSRRTLTVRRLGRRLLRTSVAIGMPSAPTPIGRFAVTDKLLTGEPDGPYGCCALALTGHQPHIPQGWGGGDRIAIHATPSPETIGQAASHGCLRARTAVMRRLVYEIPLGTPVIVRR
jgi:lipoprotein-anchoring transpeptidase ErfK/SrfK